MTENVIYLKDNFKNINSDWIEELKKIAEKSPMKRSRICFHKNKQSKIHQMLICLYKDTIIPIHSHKHSKETITLIEGRAEVSIYNKNKMVKTKYALNNKNFFMEIPINTLHSIEIKTKFILFIETIAGPFKKQNTIIY